MGVSGQRHAPAALYPRGKNPRYPLDRRLGGPQSRSGRRLFVQLFIYILCITIIIHQYFIHVISINYIFVYVLDELKLARANVKWLSNSTFLRTYRFNRNMNRMLQFSSWHTCFIFGRSRVQISARRPAIQIEGFRGLSQSLHANAGIGHNRFLPCPSQFIIHLSPYHSTLYSLSYWQCQ
jgi:hypothetical protein